MNKLSTGEFAASTEVVDETVSKLVASWEEKLKKNAKRAGGFGLMAVSLAACSDNFTQEEVDQMIADALIPVQALLDDALDDLDDALADLDDALADLAVAEGDLATTQALQAATQALLDTANAALAAAEAEVSDLEDDVLSLTDQLNTANSNLADAQAAYDALLADHTATEADLAAAEAALAAANAEVDQLTLDLDQANQDLATANATIATLNGDISDLEDDVAAHLATIADHLSTIEDLNDEIDQLEAQILGLEGDVSDLEDEVADLEAELAAMLAAIQDLGFADLDELIDAFEALNTFQLTSGTDMQIGNEFDNTFYAGVGTFGPGDVIDGGEASGAIAHDTEGDHDTLVVSVGENENAGVGATVTNVEHVTLYAVGSGATLTMSGFDDELEFLEVLYGVDEVLIDDLQNIPTISLADLQNNTSGGGDLHIDIIHDPDSADIIGSGDSMNLHVRELKNVDIDINDDRTHGVEVIDITVNDGIDEDSQFSLEGDHISEINIDGGISGQGVEIEMEGVGEVSGLGYQGATLDSTAFAGDLTITDIDGESEGTPSEITHLYLGAGDDTVEVSGGNIGAGDVYNTGSGDDVLAVTSGDINGSVDMGSGNDTLLLSDYDAQFIADNEGHNGSGEGYLNGTVDLGGGHDSFDIEGSIYGTLQTGMGNDSGNVSGSISGATVDMSGGTDNMNVSGSVVDSDIDMGEGTNTLDIEGSVSGSHDLYDWTVRTTITGGSGSDYVYIDGGISGDVDIDLGEGYATVEVSGNVHGADGSYDTGVRITTGDDSINNFYFHGDISDTEINAGHGVNNFNAYDISGSFEDLSYSGGSGHDDLYMASGVTSSDLQLGDGTNEFYIDGDVYSSSIEAGSGNDSGHIDGDVFTTTIDLGDGNNNLSIDGDVSGSVSGAILSVSGTTSITMGSGNDNLTVSGYAAGTLINLGDGDNTFYIEDEVSGSQILTGAGADSGYIGSGLYSSNVDLGDGDNNLQVSGSGYNFAITTGSGSDNVEIGGAVSGSTISLGDGANDLELGSGLFDSSVTGGADSDDFSVSGDVSGSSIDLGDGANTLHISGDVEESTITGGSGSDDVSIGEEVRDDTQINLNGGNDSLAVHASGGDGPVLEGDGQNASGNTTSTAGAYATVIDMGAGDDDVTLTLHSGNLATTVSNSNMIESGVDLDGGTGSGDSLLAEGDTGFNLIARTDDQVVNVDVSGTTSVTVTIDGEDYTGTGSGAITAASDLRAEINGDAEAAMDATGSGTTVTLTANGDVDEDVEVSVSGGDSTLEVVQLANATISGFEDLTLSVRGDAEGTMSGDSAQEYHAFADFDLIDGVQSVTLRATDAQEDINVSGGTYTHYEENADVAHFHLGNLDGNLDENITIVAREVTAEGNAQANSISVAAGNVLTTQPSYGYNYYYNSGATFTVTLDGEDFTYTTTGYEHANEVAAGLAALVDAEAEFTSTSEGDDVLIVGERGDVSGFTVEVVSSSGAYASGALSSGMVHEATNWVDDETDVILSVSTDDSALGGLNGGNTLGLTIEGSGTVEAAAFDLDIATVSGYDNLSLQFDDVSDHTVDLDASGNMNFSGGDFTVSGSASGANLEFDGVYAWNTDTTGTNANVDIDLDTETSDDSDEITVSTGTGDDVLDMRGYILSDQNMISMSGGDDRLIIDSDGIDASGFLDANFLDSMDDADDMFEFVTGVETLEVHHSGHDIMVSGISDYSGAVSGMVFNGMVDGMVESGNLYMGEVSGSFYTSGMVSGFGWDAEGEMSSGMVSGMVFATSGTTSMFGSGMVSGLVSGFVSGMTSGAVSGMVSGHIGADIGLDDDAFAAGIRTLDIGEGSDINLWVGDHFEDDLDINVGSGASLVALIESDGAGTGSSDNAANFEVNASEYSDLDITMDEASTADLSVTHAGSGFIDIAMNGTGHVAIDMGPYSYATVDASEAPGDLGDIDISGVTEMSTIDLIAIEQDQEVNITLEVGNSGFYPISGPGEEGYINITGGEEGFILALPEAFATTEITVSDSEGGIDSLTLEDGTILGSGIVTVEIDDNWATNEGSGTDFTVDGSALTWDDPGSVSGPWSGGWLNIIGADEGDADLEIIGSDTMNNFLVGGDGDDVITGGGGSGIIADGGFNYANIMIGGNGDDTITGSGFVNEVIGGSGFSGGSDDDVIDVTGTINYVMGDAGSGIVASGGIEGDDTIDVTTYFGQAAVWGGGGEDDITVDGSGFVAYVDGGAGDDTIVANGSGLVDIGGNAGDDSIDISGIGASGAGPDDLDAPEWGSGMAGIVFGDAGEDTITGSDFDDLIQGDLVEEQVQVQTIDFGEDTHYDEGDVITLTIDGEDSVLIVGEDGMTGAEVAQWFDMENASGGDFNSGGTSGGDVFVDNDNHAYDGGWDEGVLAIVANEAGVDHEVSITIDNSGGVAIDPAQTVLTLDVDASGSFSGGDASGGAVRLTIEGQTYDIDLGDLASGASGLLGAMNASGATIEYSQSGGFGSGAAVIVTFDGYEDGQALEDITQVQFGIDDDLNGEDMLAGTHTLVETGADTPATDQELGEVTMVQDWYVVDADADVMTGGTGADDFVIGESQFDNMDTIMDFEIGASGAAIDVIYLGAGLIDLNQNGTTVDEADRSTSGGLDLEDGEFVAGLVIDTIVNGGNVTALDEQVATTLEEAVADLFEANGVFEADAQGSNMGGAGLFSYEGDVYLIATGDEAADEFGDDDFIIDLNGLTLGAGEYLTLANFDVIEATITP